MQTRINGIRKYQRNEITQELEDVLFFYPESYLNNLNSYDYKPLNKNEIICEFVIKNKIGEGAFGSVHLGINKQTGEKVAIKILDKSKLKKIENKIRFEREIEILRQLKHPNIVQLYGVIEGERQIFLIMEYLKGKELFQYILLKKKIPEDEACIYFQQIISAIEYLNNLKIVHRDIKPENMIINYNKKEIKLLDFGLSNIYGDKPNELLSTACGSPCYAAPEMISGKMYKGGGIDIWSVGVVLFAMICGYLPFHEETNKETYKKIAEGKYIVPSFVSKLCRELIHKILNINPKKRIKISQIKKDAWIKFYSNGLNKDGHSLFSTGLYINKYAIPIDEEIIDEMEKLFNITKVKSRTEVLSNNSNAYTSLYYLLINKKIKKGKQSISDFKSDLFMGYLNDNRNLLTNYDNKIEKVINSRKMGVIYEQENVKNNNKKKTNLLNKEFNENIKSQDNIYNIFLKNNLENKTINFSFNNSSLNLNKNSINSNKIVIKQEENDSSKNNNTINVIPVKKRKSNNKNKFYLNIETNKESYTERKTIKTQENITTKTTTNKKNFTLKSKIKNFLDINKLKNNYKIKSLKEGETLSPETKRNKTFQLPYQNIDIKNNIIRNNDNNDEKSNNIPDKLTQLKISSVIKNSQDEIEEEKSIEDKKQEIKININKIKNENDYHNNKNEKDNIFININIINTNGRNENIEKEIKSDITSKEISNQNNIEYKDTISPIIETQKTINNTLEINKFNYYKTLDSFSLQTINQYENSRNTHNNKKVIDLGQMNTFTKEELYAKKTPRKKFAYKSSKKIKNKQKHSKLIKNFNKNIIKSEIKEKINTNKNMTNRPINNIIKKFIADNNYHKKILYRNPGNFRLYKSNNYTTKNSEINDYLKKINEKHFSEKKISKNNKNRDDKTITNLETFYTKTLNNYRNSFSPFYNKDLYFKLKINSKAKNNQFLNNIKIENDNSIKINTISIRNFKSFKNDKNAKIKEIKEKRINCYKNKINKKKYSNLKKLNIDNNIKNNIDFLKVKKKYQSPTFSYNKKRSLIREKSNKYINTENKNHGSPKNFRDILNYNNSIYKNTLQSNYKTQINSNTSRTNYNILEKNENIKNDNDMMDLEPFDLNCFFYLPKKIIKTKILNNAEKLKCKIRQINTNKYMISFDDNENIYEFNLPKNYSGIVKFKKIKGINKSYINDIRKIITNII